MLEPEEEYLIGTDQKTVLCKKRKTLTLPASKGDSFVTEFHETLLKSKNWELVYMSGNITSSELFKFYALKIWRTNLFDPNSVEK